MTSIQSGASHIRNTRLPGGIEIIRTILCAKIYRHDCYHACRWFHHVIWWFIDEMYVKLLIILVHSCLCAYAVLIYDVVFTQVCVLSLVHSTINYQGAFQKRLRVRALIFSHVNKIHIFQCMGKIFCVEFQRYPLILHTNYLTHTLKDMILIHWSWSFKSSWI